MTIVVSFQHLRTVKIYIYIKIFRRTRLEIDFEKPGIPWPCSSRANFNTIVHRLRQSKTSMCSSCQHGAAAKMFIDACTFPLRIFHLVSISFAIPWTSSLFVYYSVTIGSFDSYLFHSISSMSFLGVKEQARWLQFLVGATYFCWPDSFRSILSSWACSTILSTNRVLERPALGIWYRWYRIYAFDIIWFCI